MKSNQRARAWLCGSASLLAVAAGGGGALAQSAPPKASPESSAPSSPALEEIVVTAQRRSENLQNVPVAVSAITGSTARTLGITGTLDLQVAAPALTINETGGGGAAVTMRGVTGSGSLGDESPTAIYLDGQYLAGISGLYFSLNNIDRVEVLKGPQGTLFGRNSVGGAIQIITKTPSMSPSAEITAGYGNYNTAYGQFYGTTGLSDNVAVDLALYAKHQEDGWGKNVFLGVDAHKGEDYGARSKLLWTPTDADTVTLALGYTYTVSAAIQGGYGIRPGLVNAAGVVSTSIYNNDGNVPNQPETGQFLASVNFTHHLGWADFVSLTGFENTRSQLTSDQDLSPLSTSFSGGHGITQSFTQEFHLSSVGGPDAKLSWIAGLFYDHINQRAYTLSGTTRATSNLSNVTSPTDAYAVFAQSTYQVLPDTNLTAGLRYSVEDKSLTGYLANPESNPVHVALPESNQDESKVTYRLALDHKFAENNMAYVSVGTGYKSGVFSLGNPTKPPASAATLTAYEIGDKAQFFDNRLRLNTSVFYNDEENVQVKVTPPQGGSSFFNNAAVVHAKGFDADFTFVPTSALTFQGGVSYLDSHYISYPGAQFLFPKPAPLAALTSAVGDASGNVTIQSPTWVFTLAATYKMKTEIGDLFWTVTENHNSGYYFDPQNRVANPAYDLVNLSLKWVSTSGKWAVRGYVDNTLNKQYFSSDTSSAFGDGLYPAPPRTYGVELTANF